MAYSIHPIAELFPLVEGEEFERLVADVKANGLLDPIAIQGNVILDGRNRLRACEAASVTPCYKEVPPGTDALKYITSKNVHRRHLSTAQRADIAARMANLNKTDNLKQNRSEGSNGPSVGVSIEEAAAAMNVSPRSVKRAKAKQRKASGAAKKPRVSTVNVYHDLGLIPEAKSGGQTQRINKEVDAIDPGARASGDEERLRAAAMKVAVTLRPDEAAGKTKAAAEAVRGALPQSAQQKLDAAIRAAKRVLEMEFESRIQERVTQLLEDTVLPRYRMEHDRFVKFNAAYKGALSRDEYKRLLNFLHPDRHPEEKQAKAAALFDIVKSKEEVLCGPEEKPLSGAIPATAAELMARRRKK